MVSEITPQRYRANAQAVRMMFFFGGTTLGSLLLFADDPFLKDMHFNLIFYLGAIPSLIMFVVTLLFLRESPIHLARKGHYLQACEGLNEMKKMNNMLEVDTHNIENGDANASQGPEQTWLSQLGMIFDAKVLGTTLSLSVTCFTVNCITYGHMYAYPVIATNLMKSATPPAMQMVQQSSVSVVSAIFILLGSFFADRRTLLTLGLVIGVAGMSLFAWSGSHPERSSMEEMLFSIVQHSPGTCSCLTFTIILQVAAEAYPPSVSATGTSLVLVAGKFGSILSPLIFLQCEAWWNFYWILVQMGVLSLVMCLTMLSFEPVEQSKLTFSVRSDEERPLLEEECVPAG
jgi:MFS family permease